MPDFNIEKSLTDYTRIFGIDEAGRGPWCGPVTAACAYWPNYALPETLAQQIDDSKKLTPQKREYLFEKIIQSDCVYGIGMASAEEIDSLNILQATFLAMQRALTQAQNRFHISADFALIDGNRLPKDWTIPAQAVIKGDHLSLSIATASILAKVTRDRFMTELSALYPHYGWERNAGYGTKEHIQAIEMYGLTPYHRHSYAPIKAYLQKHAGK